MVEVTLEQPDHEDRRDGVGAGERPIKLACHNVWKLFGADAEQFLARHGGAPSREAIDDAGLIAAVRDATVEVAEGEIFLIMGLSGSGKSTLVRCLSRLIEATAGKVVFDGTPDELTTDVARSIYGADGLKEAFSEAMTSTSIAPVQFLPRTPTNAQQAP